MTVQNRKPGIILVVILTPLLCLGLGILHGVIHPNPDITVNEIGDPAGLVRAVSLVVGIIGALVALVMGPLVGRIGKGQKKDSVAGYIAPCAVAVVLSLYFCFGVS